MKHLQEKFFNHECTKEEAESFLKWYLSDQGEKQIEDQIEKYWASISQSNWDSGQVLKKIQDIKNVENPFHFQHKKSQEFLDNNKEDSGSVIFSRRFWQVAASILLLMTLSFLLYDKLILSAKTELISKVDIITKENPKGQKSTIYLKDGSTIILNSNSKISYPVEFSSTERIIELEGEAYFEVAKDVNRPFRVKTKSTVTTALGTAFNIAAFNNVDQEQISLTSGKVEVQKLGAAVAAFSLEPGQGVVYSKSSQNMTKRAIDAKRVQAWTTKELIFENDDIQEVVRRLERWYGVEISMDDQIEGVLSASFTNENLKAVLEGISYSFSLDYEMSDKKVTLKSKQ